MMDGCMSIMMIPMILRKERSLLFYFALFLASRPLHSLYGLGNGMTWITLAVGLAWGSIAIMEGKGKLALLPGVFVCLCYLLFSRLPV